MQDFWSTFSFQIYSNTAYKISNVQNMHRNAEQKYVLRNWACADVEKKHKHTHTHTHSEWTFLPLLKSHARPGLIIPAAGTWDFSFFPLKSNMNYLALCWSRWVSALRFPPHFHQSFSVCAWTVYVVSNHQSAIQNICFAHSYRWITLIFPSSPNVIMCPNNIYDFFSMSV